MFLKTLPSTLLLLALLAATSGYAQQRTVAARIVTISNDTLQGELKLQKEKKQHRNIRFKRTGLQTYSDYSPDQVKAYQLSDSLLYVAREVKAGEQPAFLKVLVTGPTSLYVAENLNSAGDFYVQRTGEPVVLLQKQNNLAELNYFLSDCSYFESGSTHKKRIKYSAESLSRTIHAYNGCRHPEELSIVLYKPTKINYLLGVSIGSHAGSTSYDGSDVFVGNKPSEKVPVSPGVAGGIFLNISDEGSSFSIQTELLYKQYKNNHTLQEQRSTRSFDYETGYLQLPLLLQFKLPRLSKLQPYLSAGLSFGYLTNTIVHQEITYHETSSRSARTVTSTDELRNRTSGFVAGGGFYYQLKSRNRLVVDLRYSQETSPIISNIRKYYLAGPQITAGITL